MESASFSALLNNVILLLGLGVIYDTLGLHTFKNKRLRDLFSGILVGGIAIAVMAFVVEAILKRLRESIGSF